MPTMTLQQQIEKSLANFRDHYLEQDWVALKALKAVRVAGDNIEINLVLGYPFLGIKDRLLTELASLLRPIVINKNLQINLAAEIDTHTGNQGLPSMPQVKNIIAVASGKGGVGKSTIAINLALALAKEGAQVGLLDADIYGPSQPMMLGTSEEKPIFQEKSLLPIKRHGIQSMSIGYLIEQHVPMVWRGPMLGKALQQLLQDTKWQSLDYLIVDLPPGTGDVQLTLCQKIPVSGAVMVTTPQDMALLDVRRACEMFNKLNVPILGIIENMSHYHCPQCGHEEKIFGVGGAAKLAKQYQLSLLGAVPLDIHIREMTDSGNPPVVAEPLSHYTQLFCEMARTIAAKLVLQNKSYSGRFPKIVVQSK